MQPAVDAASEISVSWTTLETFQDFVGSVQLNIGAAEDFIHTDKLGRQAEGKMLCLSKRRATKSMISPAGGMERKRGGNETWEKGQ